MLQPMEACARAKQLSGQSIPSLLQTQRSKLLTNGLESIIIREAIFMASINLFPRKLDSLATNIPILKNNNDLRRLLSSLVGGSLGAIASSPFDRFSTIAKDPNYTQNPRLWAMFGHVKGNIFRGWRSRVVLGAAITLVVRETEALLNTINQD